jgi:hypothetical protein
MKSTSKMWLVIIVLLSITASYAQIKNAKTESIKIYGNCEMCKATIEKAGNLKKTAKVDWNEETKMASITYDSKTTNTNAILKRIALSGYDSDSFLAPDLAYSKLMDCCKYERKSKIMPVSKVILAETQKAEQIKTNEHAGHGMPIEAKAETAKANEHASHNMPLASKIEEKVANSNQKVVSPIQAVFNNYFTVKDALVNTDAKAASTKAADLVKALNTVKMNELETDVHMVWMKVMKDLGIDAKKIAESKKIEDQRKTLIPLTKNIYALMKVAKAETPTYYQFCPMANGGKGANWLSKENEIKNPYYGSEMLTCGKVVERIK